tara:strand:- start:758 stop:985 length:228 start_codon:yes stop_codon:yes gene_type:complete
MSYELKIYNERIQDIHDELTSIRNRKKLYRELKVLCNNKYRLKKKLSKLKPILEKNEMFYSLPEELMNEILYMAI